MSVVVWWIMGDHQHRAIERARGKLLRKTAMPSAGPGAVPAQMPERKQVPVRESTRAEVRAQLGGVTAHSVVWWLRTAYVYI